MYSLGKFKQQLSLDDQMVQKGEGEQSFLPAPKSLGQALGCGVGGRAAAGPGEARSGARRSETVLSRPDPAMCLVLATHQFFRERESPTGRTAAAESEARRPKTSKKPGVWDSLLQFKKRKVASGVCEDASIKGSPPCWIN